MDTDVIALTRRLVAIDSVNPSLVPGGAGEAQIAAEVVAWARRHGLDAAVSENMPGRPSVIVRARGCGGGRSLLLCGHLDTVGGTGMTDPSAGQAAEHRLCGRGAYDMKAGVAAALVTCLAAQQAGLRGDVIAALVADEEHASIGIQEVLPMLDADAAIVTEPTELAIALAHKGFIWLEIDVHGQAAHGSRPALGVDAIVKTGPILVRLGELDTTLRSRRHPLLGSGSVHASMIDGGREMSTYPDHCRLRLERRTLPGETTVVVERELDELLGACRHADGALDAQLRTLLVREPLETEEAEPIVTGLTHAAIARLGRAPERVGASYWADSSFIAAAGIPTVLFGPSGGGAHAADEWVDVAETRACADTLTATALGFCA